MKKLMLSLLLTSSFFAIVFSCNCPDVDPYWNIIGISVELEDPQGNFPQNDSITTDTLVLKTILETKTTAQSNFNYTSLFINTAYASQPCPRAGHQGIKDQIDSINIVSNNTFLNYQANQSLNDLVQISGYSVDDWLALEPYQQYYMYENYPIPAINMHITGKPVSGSNHIFTIEYITKLGVVHRAHTSNITWL